MLVRILTRLPHSLIVPQLFMKRICFLLTAVVTAFLATDLAAAQDFTGGQQLEAEGWSGFLDVSFLLETLLTLTVASLLGAVIAFHPRTRLVIDTVEEADAPKTTITYSVIGAVIGLMVLEYGLVVGFVVFGIGGLIRFRTALPSATETGRLIFVTLIGLSAGLGLPHLAVIATAFGYGLIYALETRITYSIEVQGLEEDQVIGAANAYLHALEQHNCKIVSEKKNLSKGKLSFVFQAKPRESKGDLENAIEAEVPRNLRGVVNWEVS